MTRSFPSVLTFVLVAASQPALARTVTLGATEDTRLDQLYPNQNRGTHTGLTIASADRPLVKFAQGDITSAVNGEPLVSAHLELYVATNWNNWTSGLSVARSRGLEGLRTSGS
jgi:hypothetical protein